MTTAAHTAVLPNRPQLNVNVTAPFCLVTANEAVAAARQCAAFLRPGAFWFNGNSCSPDAKRCAARIIAAAGGRYVDMAILASTHSRLHRTPLLISALQAATAILDACGMQYRRLGDEIGAASTVKMIRPVMIKGMEALTAECMTAAHRAGVVEDVLSSLVKIRGEWRTRFRAVDKHGAPVDFPLIARRDLDAAKRFFRKAINDMPLLSPGKIGTDDATIYSACASAAGATASRRISQSATSLGRYAVGVRHRPRW